MKRSCWCLRVIAYREEMLGSEHLIITWMTYWSIFHSVRELLHQFVLQDIMGLKIRKSFLPRTPMNVVAFIFITFIIPSVYWFELYVVLPALYEMWSFRYWIHFVIGHILMLNVTGSFLGFLLIDNSVKAHVTKNDIQPDWTFCEKCHIKVPPRSWHCTVCNTCMLKRDHHCFFSGYCVGHYNYRFFVMFLFYTLLSCLYATFYNCAFLGSQMSLKKLILRTMFSLPLLISEQRIDMTHLYMLIFQIIIAGAIFVFLLCIHHTCLIVNGSVQYEQKHKNFKYNMGVKQNFINVFGERWYLSWLSPFIFSNLPNKGWDVTMTQVKKL